MKVYRIAISIDHGSSGGFKFFSSKREAARWRREKKKQIKEDPASYQFAELGETKCLEIGKRKSDVISFLNIYAGHPDNG